MGQLKELVSSAVRGYSLHGLSQQAAAIAFRVLFSLVPLVALTVSLLDLVLPERASERLVEWVVGELLGSTELEASVGNVLDQGPVRGAPGAPGGGRAPGDPRARPTRS